ncbi:GDSL esterase/lipase At1g09390 [Linum perenne]
MASRSPPLCILLLLLLCISVVSSLQCSKPPVIFNFGDSNSDTGALLAGLGFPINPPNGRTFFGASAGRLSDGRLILDFLCQSLNTSFLTPYMDSLSGSKFINGANFAVVGSSTLPKFVPFSLHIQLMQFLHFKSRSLQLPNHLHITQQGFRDALYMIDIGQNDIADSFSKNMTYVEVVKRIPSVLIQIQDAVKSLYNEGGGRKFWIHNTGPLGCLPQKLSMVRGLKFDSVGCISSYNEAAKLFNEGLRRLCGRLRTELKGATVVYVDVYSVKYDLIANATKHGFRSPLRACCGFGGGAYNYDIKVPCGQPGSGVCGVGSGSVSWDGIHYTEAANSFVASRVLSQAYSFPRLSFNFFCR